MRCSKLIINTMDCLDEPIENVKIKIFNKCNSYSFKTDKSGIGICNILCGQYILTISKKGFQKIKLFIKIYEPIKFLRLYLEYSKGIIYGRILESDGCTPCKDATVILFKMNLCNDVPIMTTETDTCGNYIFRNVVSGNYYVMAQKNPKI